MVKKTSISLDEETFKLCENYAAENSRSRSEFIASAIQKYISDLELGRQKNIIAKELADGSSRAAKQGFQKSQKVFFATPLRLK